MTELFKGLLTQERLDSLTIDPVPAGAEPVGETKGGALIFEEGEGEDARRFLLLANDGVYQRQRYEEPDPEPEEEGGPLAGVNFASDEAAEAAADADLEAADFDGREPGGKTGFVVADVEAIVAEKKEG